MMISEVTARWTTAHHKANVAYGVTLASFAIPRGSWFWRICSQVGGRVCPQP